MSDPPLRPLVSIIIPNYNYAACIREAIDSALRQTYENVEVVVVDDGSTDGSREIISEYAHSVQARFQENKGPAAARNAGIQITRGEFLAFLDSDDALLPGAVDLLLSEFHRRPECGVVFATAEHYDTRSGALRPLPRLEPRFCSFEDLIMSNAILISTALTRRAVVEQIGLFNERFRQCEDYDFWLRAAKISPIRDAEGAVVRIRIHDSNTSKNLVTVIGWELDVVSSQDCRVSLLRAARGRVCHRLAYACRIARMKHEFRKYTLEAIKADPTYWKNYAYLLIPYWMPD